MEWGHVEWEPELKIVTLLFFLIMVLLPCGVWALFAFYFGDDPNENLWGYYLLLGPLVLYLLYFLSFCQLEKSKPHTGPLKKIFRVLCLILLLVNLFDALGAYLDRYMLQRKINSDWRYSLYIHNWIQRHRLELPPTSGDTEPGPFLPFVQGKILASDVTADRWGFRREIPDRFEQLNPDETWNVVCVGGSVMFGMTTQAGDLPAPDMLQEILYEPPLHTPVRVYNAAFPGVHVGVLTRPEQLAYWRIHPDMIVFYEAINWLAPDQKSFLQNRNSWLLTRFRNGQVKAHCKTVVDRYIPTEFRVKLEQFVHLSRQKNPHIIIVLMTFSLPFTEQDTPEELAYWDLMQNGQGSAYAAAVLVRKHNQCIVEVARQYDLPLVDTRPVLNDRPQYFLDSCHLTQEGNHLLAEMIARTVVSHIPP